MRKYELKKRAESQRETHLRIVEATMELHREKGPARTSMSEVARRAGVERRTLYRHFPDPASAITREINDSRFGPGLAAMRSSLAQVLARRKPVRAMLDLALEFGTWQRLRRSGLASDAAARTMVRALLAV